MLRSLGSAGGTDILAIWLNQKYNLRIGQFNFFFNLAVFAAGAAFYNATLVLYSIILSYTYAQVMDYFLALFNQRKMVFIISDAADAIAHGPGRRPGRRRDRAGRRRRERLASSLDHNPQAARVHTRPADGG